MPSKGTTQVALEPEILAWKCVGRAQLPNPTSALWSGNSTSSALDYTISCVLECWQLVQSITAPTDTVQSSSPTHVHYVFTVPYTLCIDLVFHGWGCIPVEAASRIPWSDSPCVCGIALPFMQSTCQTVPTELYATSNPTLPPSHPTLHQLTTLPCNIYLDLIFPQMSTVPACPTLCPSNKGQTGMQQIDTTCTCGMSMILGWVPVFLFLSASVLHMCTVFSCTPATLYHLHMCIYVQPPETVCMYLYLHIHLLTSIIF